MKRAVLAIALLGCAGAPPPDRAADDDPPGLIGPPEPCVPGTGEDLDGDGHTDCTDCNDHDPDVHPGVEEVWYDGVDGDCDGAVDYDQDGDDDYAPGHGGEDCDDTDPAMHSLDHDGDGVSPCDGDCDDTEPTIHAEAYRVCGNEIDDDCDGYGDCEPMGWVSLPDGRAREIRPDGAHGFGSGFRIGDVTGDGAPDLLVDTTRLTSRIFAFDPLDADQVGADDALASFPGFTPFAAGDVNGDGVDDVVVFEDNLLGYDPVYVYLGPVAGAYDPSNADVVSWPVWAGGGPIQAGDLDGDNVAEVMAKSSSARHEFGVPSLGATWLLRGPITHPVGPGDVDAVLYSDRKGATVAVHTSPRQDLDGDGVAEVMTWDFFNDENFLVPGVAVDGLVSVQQVGLRMAPTNSGVLPAGDVNQDGHEDVYAPGVIDEVSRAFLLFGPVFADGDQDPADTWDIELLGGGVTPGIMGDHDGDGAADLVTQTYITYYSELTLLYGPLPTGVIEVREEPHAVRWVLDHPDHGGAFWVPLGDLDEDGTDDLGVSMLVGAPPDESTVFLLYGAHGGW